MIENKSQKYKTFLTEFKSSPPFVELHTLPIQLTLSKSFVSPSITNSNTKTLPTPISNCLFQQQELKKKMSKFMSLTGLKVTSLCNSSTGSLVSTQLLADAYKRTKPNVTITTTTTPGINKDQ